ncbi:MAG: aminotransferase class III-fold pyridoxal phosphate-dependent enzyme [Candidatus Diapherotrites archaeon]
MQITLKTMLPGPKSKGILNRLRQRNGAFNIDHAYVHSGEGKGSHFSDMDGNVFLDFSAQIASNPLGYNNPTLLNIMKKYAQQTPIKYGGQDFVVKEHVELLEELRSITPKEFDKGFLINSGAEANENALKIACHRRPTAKVGISFKNGWHGRTTGALSLTNSKSVQVKHFLRLPVRHISYNDNGPGELEELLKREFDADEIGFVIMEGVQGEGGYLPATTPMVKEIRRVTKQYGIPLIFDEIQAGMGRTGKWWTYQHHGITPDIQTSAKMLQVGATLANKKWFPKEKGAISSTWGGGHILDMAMGTAIIREIKKKKLLQNATLQGKEIGKWLNEIHAKTDKIHRPRGIGLMRAFDVKNTKMRNLFQQKCFKEGVIVLGCGWEGIRISPSLNITKEEVNEGMTVIEKVTRGMR